MDSVWTNEIVLEQIFNHLDGKTLFNASLVCKIWYHTAYRLLSRRKSDIFYVMTIPTLSKKYYKNGPGTKFVGYSPEGHFQNRIEISTRCAVPNETIRNFLATNTRCYPASSLIFSRTVAEITEPLTPDNYGTIVVRGQGVIIYPFLENRIWQIPLYTTRSPLETGGWLLSKYFSDFQIDLTDWNSSDFQEPIIDHPEYPIQGILVFVKDFLKIVDVRFVDFIEKVQRLRKNVLICYPVDGISYRRHGKTFFNETNALSIAFCGHKINTARLTFIPSESEQISEELIKFKNSLEFNPDVRDQHMYTIGLIFDHVGCMPTYAYIDKINSTFSQVIFTGLTMSPMALHDSPSYSSAFTFWDLKNNQIARQSRIKKIMESGIGAFIRSSSSRGEFPLLYRGVSLFLVNFSRK